MDSEHQWTREELLRDVDRHGLTLREREIMTLRYGLLDGQSHIVEEVGHTLHITAERVRMIEERAWRKLNHGGLDGEAGAFVRR